MTDTRHTKQFAARLSGADLKRSIEEVLAPILAGNTEVLIVYAVVDGQAVLRVVGSPIEILTLYNQMDPRFIKIMEEAQRNQNLNG